VPTDDPDAMWKPGFTGEVVYPGPRSADRPSRSNRRRLAIVGIGVVGLLAGGVAISRLAHDVAPAGSSERDRIPVHARERWTATLDAASVDAVTATPDTVVAATGPEPTLVALAADSGRERWRAPVPWPDVVALEVVDGVVVAVSLDEAGEQSIAGLDLRDGRVLWAETLAAGGQAQLAEGQIVVVRFGTSGRVIAVELVDPATGERRRSVAGDEVSLSSRSVQRRDGDVIEWYERGSFEPRGRMRLPDQALASLSPRGVAPTAAGLVVATPRVVTLLGPDGAVLSVAEVSSERDHLEAIEVDGLDGSGRFVMLQGRGHVTMFSIADGTLTEQWSRRAWMVDWLIDSERQLVALVPQRAVGGDNGPAGASLVIVDATTGRPMWSGGLARAVVPFRGILTDNGFIAAADPDVSVSSAVTGYDLDGATRWRHPIADDVRTTFVSGALVTVGADAATGDVTLTLVA
jgi:outer membrane protein assembly factor BamB